MNFDNTTLFEVLLGSSAANRLPPAAALHNGSNLTTEAQISTCSHDQIDYCFYGLGWITGLVPVCKKLWRSIHETDCVYIAELVFPQEAVNSMLMKYSPIGKNMFKPEIPYLIQYDRGRTAYEAKLKCIAKYSFAMYNVEKYGGNYVHGDAGLMQHALEQKYCQNRIDFSSLDELELLLSSRGFEYSKGQTYDKEIRKKAYTS